MHIIIIIIEVSLRQIMNKQLAQIHLCPWELIDLDTSNLEFVVVFFNADTVEKKSKQEFKIQHVQSDELPNIY